MRNYSNYEFHKSLHSKLESEELLKIAKKSSDIRDIIAWHKKKIKKLSQEIQDLKKL
jgi:arsenate reductase-like glutaredoxin family protein